VDVVVVNLNAAAAAARGGLDAATMRLSNCANVAAMTGYKY